MPEAMICINPECHQNFEPSKPQCPYCGTATHLAGRYELKAPLRKLSRLNPVSVFLGFDHETRSEVVIKVLDYPEAEYQRHFRNEIGALGNIRHPGLPKVDLDEGGYFTVETTSASVPELTCFAMEKIPGVTLDDYIANQGKISQAQAIQWLSELVEILSALHDRQIFHRDIKPSNIMVKPNGSLAIIDFGSVRSMTNTYLAKLGVGPDEVTQKSGITVFASAAYTAYEQLQGRAVPQSDFFSLGRTLVYALTGANPAQLKDDAAGKLQWRHLSPQISPVFANDLDRLMELLSVNRPRNTDEIKTAIAQLPKAIQREKLKSSPLAKALMALTTGLALWGGWTGYSWYMTERHLSSGLRSALEGNYDEAKSKLETALVYSPNNEKLHSNLAAICQQIPSDIGQNCAIEHSKKALAIGSDNDAFIYYNLGGLYEGMDNIQLAIANYQLALEKNPKFIPARNNLARLHIIQKEYSAAEKLLSQEFLASQARETQAILLKNQGWLQYEQQQYSQAAKTLTEALRLNPDETASYCLLAKTHDALPKLGASQEFWQRCLSGPASSPEVEAWQDQKLRRLFDKKNKTML